MTRSSLPLFLILIRIIIRKKKNAGKSSKKQFAAVVLCEPSKYGPVVQLHNDLDKSARPSRRLDGLWKPAKVLMDFKCFKWIEKSSPGPRYNCLLT